MTITPPALRGVWRDDDDARAVYSEAAGIQRIVPLAIAVPADAADVVALVRWAVKHRVPLTPRGSGSSMAGGAIGAGVVVDLSRLNSIGAIDGTTRTVVAGPGAICADVDAAAQRVGLRFPIDPSSARFCTVGGMSATNAAGARTLRYGQMNAWIEGLECAFADGSHAWVRRGERLPSVPALDRLYKLAGGATDGASKGGASKGGTSKGGTSSGVRKQSSGYGLAAWQQRGSAIDLLAGSEGTLAIFTAVKLRLAPLPGASATILASFASIENAAEAAAVAAELNATACELLDRTFLQIARGGGRIAVPEGADAVLLVELEEPTIERLREMASAMAGAFRGAGAVDVETALDEPHAAKLWQLRHAASPMLAALSRASISMQVVEDGAVPPARLAEYVRGLRALINANGFEGVLFGHAGDGHVHANVLVDVASPDWRARLQRVFDDGVSLVASLGGTLSGEHGDGRLRAGALSRVWSRDALAAFQQVKHAFDPDGILNPGVKLAQPGDAPLGGPVKYDPALPALPAAARAALDRVQRERLWSAFRLSLLADESPH